MQVLIFFFLFFSCFFLGFGFLVCFFCLLWFCCFFVFYFFCQTLYSLCCWTHKIILLMVKPSDNLSAQMFLHSVPVFLVSPVKLSNNTPKTIQLYVISADLQSFEHCFRSGFRSFLSLIVFAFIVSANVFHFFARLLLGLRRTSFLFSLSLRHLKRLTEKIEKQVNRNRLLRRLSWAMFDFPPGG